MRVLHIAFLPFTILAATAAGAQVTGVLTESSATLKFRPGAEESQKKDLSAVINDAKAQNVQKIEVSGNNLNVTLDDGGEYSARKEDNSSLVEILTTNGVEPLPTIEIKEPSAFGDWFGLLLQFLPILIFIGLIVFMMRQAQGSNSQAMSFGKS